jgi:hypothetical protein
LIACSSHDKYAVDGVGEKFCVPKEVSPPDIWYVPDDAPDIPKSFAIIGCGYVMDGDLDKCKMPDGLISASIRPLSVHINHTWRDLAGAVLFDEVFNSPGAKYEWIDRRAGVFVLKSQSSWIPWTIWKRNESAADAAPLKLQGSDELMADCAPTYTQYEVDGTTHDLTSISCKRYVVGRAYAVEYAFKRRRDLPGEGWLHHFDAELFAKIDSWRCPS